MNIIRALCGIAIAIYSITRSINGEFYEAVVLSTLAILLTESGE